MNRNADWSRAENLLCIRADTIGDVLMTTPALRALKESHPGRRLTLLTSSAAADLVPLLEDVDDLIVYDAPWVKASTPREDGAEEREMIDRLRARSFDGAVIFTVFSQNPLPAALMCFLADIPLRLAYCRENPYQLLTDWVPDPDPGEGIRHEVVRQIDLVRAIACSPADDRLALRIPDRARMAVDSLVAELGLSHGRWIAVHPGATAPSRRYDPAAFARVATTLATEDDLAIVFTGSKSEAELVEGIRRQMDAAAPSLAGRLDLGELAALLEAAPVLLSNNTGPVHIAAAVGTPVVDLYALTNPQHTPWRVPARVLYQDVPCKYCFKSVCPHEHNNCLRLVAPSQVVAAVRDLLAEVYASA